MMGIHKLTAGDGYLYLIRQTAAHDAEQRGRASLGDYYSEKGESPGRWMAEGYPGCRIRRRAWVTDVEEAMWRIDAGSAVTEDQMKAIYGLGLHPNAGKIAEHLIANMGAPKAAAKELSALAARSSSTTPPPNCNAAWPSPTATTTSARAWRGTPRSTRRCAPRCAPPSPASCSPKPMTARPWMTGN